MNAPAWLDDATEILQLLNKLVDRLDKQPAAERTYPVGIALNEKTLPALFTLDDKADHLWDLIKSLEEDHQIIRIKLKKQHDPFTPVYNQAKLTLHQGREKQLRDWLQRPAGFSPLQHWRKTIETLQPGFPGKTDRLSAHRIVMQDQDDASVLAAFVRIGQFQHTALSLRQLSSLCFQGNSKFLDNREMLIRELFPDLNITVRPVMVNIFIPESIDGILFIENQDSYVNAVATRQTSFKNLVLVYVAGFKGSATRIRQPEGASLHYHGESSEQARQQLEHWWFGQQPGDWPVWFWGDLDYSGMGILKALKQRFVEISAWQAGYEPLLQLLRQQQGHRPAMADKQAQKDPVTTGCEYADTVLLPAIREMETFIDQEAWTTV